MGLRILNSPASHLLYQVFLRLLVLTNLTEPFESLYLPILFGAAFGQAFGAVAPPSRWRISSGMPGVRVQSPLRGFGAP